MAAALTISAVIAERSAGAQQGRAQIDAGIRTAEKFYSDAFYRRARNAALVVLQAVPESRRALLTYGWSQYQLGNFASAKRAFARLARSRPNNVDAQVG
ncbi:MAG: hypothetical protein OEQ29_15325, partial [Alphaproteobacteria bacterium]|nr:hypothetical protein [Alphaproteobacteria bacterium]